MKEALEKVNCIELLCFLFSNRKTQKQADSFPFRIAIFSLSSNARVHKKC